MAFHNYILLVALILLLGFRIVLYRRKPIRKVWLKRTLNLITTIAVIVTALAVALFPNFGSVKATGEHAFSSCVIELADMARIEEFKNDGSPRKLSMLVYYPQGDGVKNNSCPLIVFSHGGISTKTSNLSLYEELASHGYVVVSVEHTYHALSTEIGGERVGIDAGYMKELNHEDSHSDIENSYRCFQKWMKLRTDDINFVIDTFIRKAAEDNRAPYSLIDAKRIGVAGHSLGGSAALGIARQRKDIQAVMALESPYMCDMTGVDAEEFTWDTTPYSCAVMNIYSNSGYPLINTDNKYVQNKHHLYNQGNVEYYYIEGSNHYTLTDLVRTSPALCVFLGGTYKKSGYDTLEFINQKSLAFFDRYL